MDYPYVGWKARLARALKHFAMTVQEAKKRRVCRICKQRISTDGWPKNALHEFGKLVFPERIILNFGREFAHAKCLEKTK